MVVFRFFIILCCIFVSQLGIYAYAEEASSELEQYDARYVYTLGVVPQFEQRKLFQIWRPILDQLERKTRLRFRLSGSPKISAFEKNLFSGKYDFAYMNPYHFVKANQFQGYLPLIRDGKNLLQGIILVKKESGLRSIEDLQGRLISFPSPNALAASLLTRRDLATLYDLQYRSNFVKTHSSVYLHVALGLSDAGGGVLRTFNSQDQALRQALKIIYKTTKVNAHPLAVHPRINQKIWRKVQAALIEISQTELGKTLFSRIPMDQVIKAEVADYDELSNLGLEKFWNK